MRGFGKTVLVLALASGAPIAWGQEIQWRSAGHRPAAATAGTPAVTLGAPIPVTLGRPVPLDTPAAPAILPVVDPHVTPTSYQGAPVIRGQSPELARPMPSGPVTITAGSAPVGTAPAVTTANSAPVPTTVGSGTVVPPTPEEQYNAGVVTSPVPPAEECGTLGCWWEECCACFRGLSFRSDHCFDGMISPITNPYLFEDPRSLTELRPVYIFQKIPSNNPAFGSGEINAFTLQTRLHLTDWLSVVVSRLGWLDLSPDAGAPFGGGSGFSELNIGPKYTFLRLPDIGTIAAAGINFQIPSGPASTFQDTGDLSLQPYLSFGQTFWRSSYGSFNFIGTTGASFAVDGERTDYYFLSLHLDYNVANANKFYPLIELHWFNYFHDGKVNNFDFEGRDLINFGSTDVAGNNTLSMAAGFRYKFTEWAQAGIAAEWPISGHRDLQDFRLTVDFILRY